MIKADMQLLASAWYQSGAFWTIVVGAVATLVGGVVGAYFNNRFVNPKRELQYQWWKNTSLLETSDPSGSSLRVQHGTTTLTEPRVIDVLLRNVGKKEITASDFHLGKPIEISLDSTIIEVKSVTTEPPTSVVPSVGVSHTNKELLISPCLLVGRQEVFISVVADGPGDERKFSLRAPLIGIDPKRLPDALNLDVMLERAVRTARQALVFFIVSTFALIASIAVAFLSK
ncbi:hypothetical protein ACIQ9J_06700 [Streptomyces sp. NPDC094153]|uniref:hypothetical protein n=1 Tax=Streptomyces sp. NPDC094153 TaxID=3366058 RepID=UPI0037F3C3AE